MGSVPSAPTPGGDELSRDGQDPAETAELESGNVVIDWRAVSAAELHLLRIGVLECRSIDGGRTMSSTELSVELQVPLSNTNYHVVELHKSGLIKLVGRKTGAPIGRPPQRPNSSRVCAPVAGGGGSLSGTTISGAGSVTSGVAWSGASMFSFRFALLALALAVAFRALRTRRARPISAPRRRRARRRR